MKGTPTVTLVERHCEFACRGLGGGGCLLCQYGSLCLQVHLLMVAPCDSILSYSGTAVTT